MTSRVPGPDWPDERLVTLCLDGSEAGWNALVDRYKNLVWSIILRYGVAPDQAPDVFQAVWLDVYNDLGQLRRYDDVKPWLSSVVRNKCYHWRRKSNRRQQVESAELEPENGRDEMTVEASFVADLERQQLVRQAIESLGGRCREMIRLLFFHQPPLPYKDVAERLGLAVGSIGFVRGRCLKKLQKAIEALDLD